MCIRDRPQAPSTTGGRVAGWSMSPATTSAPRSARALLASFSGSRVRARTVQPPLSRWRTTAPPCCPVAPPTRMVLPLLITLLASPWNAIWGAFWYQVTVLQTPAERRSFAPLGRPLLGTIDAKRGVEEQQSQAASCSTPETVAPAPNVQESAVLFKYAWRGFTRRRTRTSLAITGIALSIALLVAVVSISSSVERAVSDSLGAAGADMVVQRRVKPCPFTEVKLPKDLAEIQGDVVDKIRATDKVEAVSGVLLLWAFYQGHPTVVAGIDPTMKTIGPVRISQKSEEEKAATVPGGAASAPVEKTKKKDKEEKSCCAISEGRYLVRYDDKAVMLTEEYATAVGKKVGDSINIGPREVFQIVGLVKLTGSARIAEAEAFIPLSTAQRMYGKGPIVDTIFVALKDPRSIPLVTRIVEDWIGTEASITTSQNVDAATSAVANLTRRSMLGVSALVLFFAFLLILRNALSAVAERLNEVGLMRAIGWRRSDVYRLFFAEELFGGAIGGVIGCLAGWALAFGYSQIADLKLPSALTSFPPCSTTQPPLALPLQTTPSLAVFLIGLATALLIGSVAGLAASNRAAPCTLR
eukprot:TRINITY_DN11273_c0_g1_i1.p1 TRINITY_DN11273_c0_g1~~TRINITY_DN11273_c0_g1_i1.p1  ORF type:complete len:624 (+),score=59.83 TRINITY_DN11273_c0_g1_i1:122-1873(+)